MRLTKLFVLLALAGGGAAEAATLNASSCNLSAVSLVVTSAVDGDTVVIPAGTCSWSGPLSISNKSITLKGQGIGATVIVSTHATDPLLLSWSTKPSGVSKVSDLTFDSGSPVANGYLSMVVIGGDTANFVMQNVRLIERRQRAITFYGYVRGVMSRVVVDTYTFSVPIHFSHQAWGGVGDNGDNSWAQDSTMGTAQALYVEDSTITCYIGSYCPATDGDAGPRYVFRFNKLTNAQSFHHGLDTPGRPRGARQWEYYNNVIVNNAMQGVNPIGARSGTGMVFDNQLTVSGNGSSSAVVDFQTQRANQDPVVSGFFFPWNDCRVRQIAQITCSGGVATVTTPPVGSGQTSHGVSEGGWVEIAGSSIAAYNGKKAVTSPTTYSGRSSNSFTFASSCGGTASNSGMTLASPLDGNTNASGYPCMDQIGRGKGALISGFDALGRYNLGVLSATKANQQSEPLYIWNNTRNGALSAGVAVYTDPSAVAENRDYFNQDNTNCAPGGGSCAAGVGRGTLAQRPASCSPGVGYWATDQGEWNSTNGGTPDGRLYKCVSANNWAPYYMPYAYPHPLVTGAAAPAPDASGSGSGSAPQPPQNLRILTGN